MIHKIPTSQTVVDGLKVKPGDTVILSGIYPVSPYFKGLDRVEITNEGPVELFTSVKFDNCKSFSFKGTPKIPIRVKSQKKDTSGVTAYNRSTDFEWAYLEISETSFAGFMAKSDGEKRGGDFTMRNLKIHHNKISKTGGEGMYIGATNPAGHDLESVEIYDNELTDIGWDGIQLGNCVKGGIIRDNRITRTGVNITRKEDEVQDNGLQIGDRSKVKIYRNTIRDVRGNGIIALGTGCDIYDNRIFRAGESGIYSDTRADSTEPNTFRSNWILAPKMYCIACRDRENKGFKNKATDNRLFNPGKAFFENGNDLTDSKNNNFLGNDMLFVEHLMKSL